MAKHLPGSLNVDTPEKAIEQLHPDDDIVVYCTNPRCFSSQMVYRILVSNGYKNVRRFAGEIEEWEQAGYLLEGEMVE